MREGRGPYIAWFRRRGCSVAQCDMQKDCFEPWLDSRTVNCKFNRKLLKRWCGDLLKFLVWVVMFDVKLWRYLNLCKEANHSLLFQPSVEPQWGLWVDLCYVVLTCSPGRWIWAWVWILMGTGSAGWWCRSGTSCECGALSSWSKSSEKKRKEKCLSSMSTLCEWNCAGSVWLQLLAGRFPTNQELSAPHTVSVQVN